ncbi:MAG: AAA family ATPase [bacterium]|nr:AAA family ATPase [bacterium]
MLEGDQTMAALPDNQRRSRTSVLILGDWVVDEYWFLVQHHSRISSHTGLAHYRVLTEQEQDAVVDLCGAGHIARVLYDLQRRDALDLDLIGIGNWYGQDTDLIGHLVHARGTPGCEANFGGYRLTPTPCKADPGIRLHTLNPASPTIRVIRLYHDQGDGLEQLSRVDWEPSSQHAKVLQSRDQLSNLELPEEGQVLSIVVNDLNKGVVTESLVLALARKYPEASWYVRTKKLKADWLEKLTEERHIRLLVLGPEVAALLRPWDRWLEKGRVTLEAKNALVELKGDNVVLISDQHEAIILLDRGKNLATGNPATRPSLLSQLGWPTALFGALVAQLQSSDSSLTRENIREALQTADTLAGITPPSRLRIREETRELTVSTVRDWRKELAKWDDAWKGYGIITGAGEPQALEVWRAMGQLPGYVACTREKRQIIEEIGRALRKFKKTADPTHSLSILLQADPGAGKTYLAEALAHEFDFDLIRYDITQMLHREELLDLFETVATAQTGQARRPLVFVDEINAPLENEQLWGAFLAPLEQGIYVRRGKKFGLNPCVWIFAGTKFREASNQPADKLNDFMSRMSLIEKLDYDSLQQAAFERAGKNAREQFIKEAQLEQVYLGAMMIRREYKDVREISRQILKHFYHGIDPAGAPARELRRLAQTLEDVQYGRVTVRNCDAWHVKFELPEDKDTTVRLEF